MISLTHDNVYDAFNKANIVSKFITDLKGDFTIDWDVFVMPDIFEQQYSKESAIKGICKVLNVPNTEKITNHISVLLDDMGIDFIYLTCDDLEWDFNEYITEVNDELAEEKWAWTIWNP